MCASVLSPLIDGAAVVTRRSRPSISGRLNNTTDSSVNKWENNVGDALLRQQAWSVRVWQRHLVSASWKYIVMSNGGINIVLLLLAKYSWMWKINGFLDVAERFYGGFVSSIHLNTHFMSFFSIFRYFYQQCLVYLCDGNAALGCLTAVIMTQFSLVWHTSCPVFQPAAVKTGQTVVELGG